MKIETLEDLMDELVEDVYKKKKKTKEEIINKYAQDVTDKINERHSRTENNNKKITDIFDDLPNELKGIAMAIAIVFGEDFIKTFNNVEVIMECDRTLKESINAIFACFSAGLGLDYKLQVIES